jgi:hypothetical protein
MKSVYQLCLLLLLNLSLGACVKVSDDPTDNQPAATAAGGSQVEVEKTLEAPHPEVMALAEPFKYQVHLPMAPDAQIVQRSIESSDVAPVLLPMNLQNGVFTDLQPESDRNYVYEMGVVRNGSLEILQTYKVRVPKDGLIDSERPSLAKDETWNYDGRLFLTPKAVITTAGHNLTIETQQLIVDQAKIRNFLETDQAAVGQPGHVGGLIRITTRTGKGLLRVEMRGQRGGDGHEGPAFEQTAAPGMSMPGGFGGGGFITLLPGIQGKPGENGFAGGSSGTFYITILEAHQMTILPLIEAGKGGAGGLGGPGSPAYPGWNMDAGARGETGKDGPAGAVERSYIEDLKGQRAL